VGVSDEDELMKGDGVEDVGQRAVVSAEPRPRACVEVGVEVAEDASNGVGGVFWVPLAVCLCVLEAITDLLKLGLVGPSEVTVVCVSP